MKPSSPSRSKGHAKARRKTREELNQEARDRKRQKKRRGHAPGSRAAGGNTTSGSKGQNAPKDPRIGSKTPIPLGVTEKVTKQHKPKSEKPMLSPQAELELLETDERLDALLERLPGELSGGQRQALTLLMATMVPPKLLLLDEHTAALDPATAEKVLRLTREIVEGERITCLMITHNMKNALELGNRTFMMDAGRVVLDISGEERKGLTVDDLLERFRAGAGKNLDNDRILLSND